MASNNGLPTEAADIKLHSNYVGPGRPADDLCRHELPVHRQIAGVDGSGPGVSRDGRIPRHWTLNGFSGPGAPPLMALP